MSLLERRVVGRFSSLLPFLEGDSGIVFSRRKIGFSKCVLTRSQELSEYCHRFQRDLDNRGRLSLFHFSTFRKRVFSLLELGQQWQSYLKTDHINCLFDSESERHFKVSDFLKVYLKAARGLHSFVEEGAAKYCLSLVFFLLAVFLLLFALFCMMSSFSCFFSGLCFCFSLYLAIVATWDLSSSLASFQDILEEQFELHWVFLSDRLSLR
ncbi:hypothetical protein HAT2_00560 [Candidatus Similichlamydia laticola]|uniref:Uncharacterized protein n=1 Tax=Candidatus Similichlamydia laticola TaxID=2170265 RepID=A0A369KK18_9BACT|nr:hypothetical protein HAT2_00560 [Candidatus Similichlamydia laticola]